MADVLRLSLLGTMAGGEVFSINPTFSVEPPGGSLSYDDCLAIATAVDAVTIPTGVLALLNSSTAWTGVRVEARTFAGTLEALAEHAKTTPVQGATSGASPFQTALVLSLQTTFPGASGRGRLYFPVSANILVQGTQRVNATTLANFLSGAKTYLQGIQTAVQSIEPLSTLHVWSRKNEAMYQVTKLRVGDITDVQRRRRDSAVENYSSVAY